jgi:hypothetical protein
MISHTLILSTPKTEIPNDGIISFIKELITNNLFTVDYFGIELDNQDDYRNDEMQSKFDNTTIVTFHFESISIDYQVISEHEIFTMIHQIIDSDAKTNIIVDEKDVDIYVM